MQFSVWKDLFVSKEVMLTESEMLEDTDQDICDTEYCRWHMYLTELLNDQSSI